MLAQGTSLALASQQAFLCGGSILAGAHFGTINSSTATKTTPRGFEPLRAEPNGFLVHLLDRTDTVSPPFWARPKPTLCARRLVGTLGTVEALESSEVLEVSEKMETMDTSSACEAIRASALRCLQGFPAVVQGLLRSCCRVSRRCLQGSHKACKRLS